MRNQVKPLNRPEGAPWSLDDAASYLSLCTRTVRRMIDAGQIRAIRFGRRLLVPDVEVKRIAAEGIGGN